MTETLCDSGAVKLKAGLNASSLTATQYTQLINQAEGYINTQSRYNWVDAYSGLNVDVKQLLEDCASSYAAINAIAYDMTDYNSISEAQTLMDVNWAKAQNILEKLKDEKFRTFVQEA